MLALLLVIFLLGTGSLVGQVTLPSGGSYSLPASPACRPHLEYDQQIRVDIDPEKEFTFGRELYQSKENQLWVLVKRNAPIPAWKVWGGWAKCRFPDPNETLPPDLRGQERIDYCLNHGGEVVWEMEDIGTTLVAGPGSPNPDAQGKRVFIGTGHCNGEPGISCLDPLTSDTLFVVQKEGVSPPLPDWAHYRNPAEDPQREDYWWEFNLYYDLAKLPANPTNEDLPCWMKMECGVEDVGANCRKWLVETDCGQAPGASPPPFEECQLGSWAKGQFSLLAKLLARFKAFSQETSPPSFIRKEAIAFDDPATEAELEEIYWSESEINVNPAEDQLAERIGVYPEDNPVFDVFYSFHTKVLTLTSPASPPYYNYVPLISVVEPGAKTLQLGTFFPIRSFHYEWYTPACKPAIYLYPEKPTRLTVKLKPAGQLTVTDPQYDPQEGWEVLAYPDGSLKPINNQQLTINNYPYLYYEAEIEKVKVPDQGWVVKKEDLEKLFDLLLPFLGLNKQESADFKDYWLRVLNEAPYYFVGVIERSELETIEPIHFSLKPDTFIRVRLFFEGLGKPVPVRPPVLSPSPTRQGFVAVDWGGILSSGSCQSGEALNSTSR